mgnify:CR=1 FL=1
MYKVPVVMVGTIRDVEPKQFVTRVDVTFVDFAQRPHFLPHVALHEETPQWVDSFVASPLLPICIRLCLVCDDASIEEGFHYVSAATVGVMRREHLCSQSVCQHRRTRIIICGQQGKTRWQHDALQ